MADVDTCKVPNLIDVKKVPTVEELQRLVKCGRGENVKNVKDNTAAGLDTITNQSAAERDPIHAALERLAATDFLGLLKNREALAFLRNNLDTRKNGDYLIGQDIINNIKIGAAEQLRNSDQRYALNLSNPLKLKIGFDVVGVLMVGDEKEKVFFFENGEVGKIGIGPIKRGNS